MELYEMTALDLAEKIKLGEITPTQVVLSLADAVQEREHDLNCFASFDVGAALAEAKNVEKRMKSGEKLSLLAGVPIAVKDNICESGKVASCASKMLEGFVPPYDATVIKRIKNAGMIPLGRTNMDEFAMGWSTENTIYGATKNPWNTSRVAGGSSGGSAAAVAAEESVIALGSDTGGSIRQPCSFCGVTGLKPTYGAVSRYGLIAFASSLDTIGAIGKNALDTAALFGIISGRDDKDATTDDSHSFCLDDINSTDLKGVKVGIPSEFFGDGMSADVEKCVREAAEVFTSLGAEVIEFSLPLVKYVVPAYYIIACAEASSNLARYDGVKYGHRSENADTLDELYRMSRSEGFSTEVKKRIMLGNFVLSAGYFDAYYKKALKVKGLICAELEKAFESFDFLLAPVSPKTAYALGEGADNPMSMYLGDVYTAIVNLAGLPSLALPCGFGSDGMPVGMQLIGKAFDERTILSAGCAYQSVTDFHTKKPFCRGGSV